MLFAASSAIRSPVFAAIRGENGLDWLRVGLYQMRMRFAAALGLLGFITTRVEGLHPGGLQWSGGVQKPDCLRRDVVQGGGTLAAWAVLGLPVPGLAAGDVGSTAPATQSAPATSNASLPMAIGSEVRQALDRLCGAIPCFAVVTPEGFPLVSVNLDGKGRVRTVAYFFESASTAESVRQAALSVDPKGAAGALVLPVPLSEALALILQPPFKATGLPGYYAHRMFLDKRILDAALSLTGLESLAETAVPVFYEDSPESEVKKLFLDPADFVASAGTKYLRTSDKVRPLVTDLTRLARNSKLGEDSGTILVASSKVLSQAQDLEKRARGPLPAYSTSKWKLILELDL